MKSFEFSNSVFRENFIYGLGILNSRYLSQHVFVKCLNCCWVTVDEFFYDIVPSSVLFSNLVLLVFNTRLQDKLYDEVFILVTQMTQYNCMTGRSSNSNYSGPLIKMMFNARGLDLSHPPNTWPKRPK